MTKKNTHTHTKIKNRGWQEEGSRGVQKKRRNEERNELGTQSARNQQKPVRIMGIKGGEGFGGRKAGKETKNC